MDKSSMEDFEKGFLEDIKKWSETEYADEDEKNKELKLIQTKHKLIKDYYDAVTQFKVQEERLKIDRDNANNRLIIEQEKNKILKKDIALKSRELDFKEREFELREKELDIKNAQVLNDKAKLDFEMKQGSLDNKLRVADRVLGAAGKGLVGGLLYFMYSTTTHAEYKDNVIVRPKVKDVFSYMFKLLI